MMSNLLLPGGLIVPTGLDLIHNVKIHSVFFFAPHPIVSSKLPLALLPSTHLLSMQLVLLPLHAHPHMASLRLPLAHVGVMPPITAELMLLIPSPAHPHLLSLTPSLAHVLALCLAP